MSDKYYLTGPMSNVPQFNFPLFAEASANLRSAGWNIVSPHEEDAPEVQAAAWASPDGKFDPDGKTGGKTWGDMLAGDVKLIADDVAGIIFLPNWTRSRGAQLEAFTGLLCNRKFYLYDTLFLRFVCRIHAPYVREQLRAGETLCLRSPKRSPVDGNPADSDTVAKTKQPSEKYVRSPAGATVLASHERELFSHE